ncbi:uncharacterized protein MYCFIDRAFT_171828 [Pseudocercospora fijiensis CIRAD86]|uniref:Uncharacterized protein n=1 Tax=Pseudocercospora fijiensis (strain CIRAD86) TaxID=383855 RepID=M2Z899_PSEFD|nr:uncharacterized protein MYCFIDRAFT_171828 [Pseudocercospora fijiensis CIRAD86]EME86000.1 hypothetical protein MYCFIDRAFT_171828 [Pseudocercospora fijiensis CIRAD86]
MGRDLHIDVIEIQCIASSTLNMSIHPQSSTRIENIWTIYNSHRMTISASMERAKARPSAVRLLLADQDGLLPWLMRSPGNYELTAHLSIAFHNASHRSLTNVDLDGFLTFESKFKRRYIVRRPAQGTDCVRSYVVLPSGSTKYGRNVTHKLGYMTTRVLLVGEGFSHSILNR